MVNDGLVVNDGRVVDDGISGGPVRDQDITMLTPQLPQILIGQQTFGGQGDETIDPHTGVCQLLDDLVDHGTVRCFAL